MEGREAEVDLGGQQELGRVGAEWRVDVERVLGLVFHARFRAVEDWPEREEGQEVGLKKLDVAPESTLRRRGHNHFGQSFLHREDEAQHPGKDLQSIRSRIRCEMKMVQCTVSPSTPKAATDWGKLLVSD